MNPVQFCISKQNLNHMNHVQFCKQNANQDTNAAFRFASKNGWTAVAW